jgi:transposase-like protein
VHYDAVNEFEALPEGYAKVIQPMRPYTEAEEWALNKSMELYGFIGTIVYDQYGRILDGNQRQRIARLRGLTVPFTIM